MTRQRLCLSPSEWPAPDREFWAHASQPGGLFTPSTPAASWRPRTIQTVAEGYGYALAWLDRRGHLEVDCPPEARWSADRLCQYIEDMRARKLSPATVHNRVLALERALAVLAPASDRSMLRVAIKNLNMRSDGSRKRNRLQDPARLVDLGFTLMRDAENSTHKSARKNASMYRDGLQIALLASRALRKANFISLRIGTHLVRQMDAWWLIFKSHETKTSQPIEVPFPEQLVPALLRYLGYWRPLLAGKRYSGDRLWLSYRFQPQVDHSFQLQLVDRTKKNFGKSINPHLFRDCLATSIAIHDPQNVRMAATILGHRSFATTERHYNLACTLEAGRSYSDLICSRRRSSSRPRRRSP